MYKQNVSSQVEYFINDPGVAIEFNSEVVETNDFQYVDNMA